MQDTDLPTYKFPIPWAKNANTSDIRTIPTASQIGIQDGAASLNDGYPPLCLTPLDAGGIPPFGQDTNGILLPITQWLQWMQAGGPIPYDSTFQTAISGYPKDAIVRSATTTGLFWRSTADANTTNPDSAGAGWVAVSAFPRAWKALSASTTITIADHGTYFDITASATITLPAPSACPGVSFGFLPTGAAGCTITTPSGVFYGAGVTNATSISLWQGSWLCIQSNGTNWRVFSMPSRQVLNANLTLFVNGSTGNDANNGLTSGTPFLTIGAAVRAAYSRYDFAGLYSLTFTVASGTYNEAVAFLGMPQGLLAPIMINGTAGFTLINSTAAAAAITATSGATIIPSGLKVQGSDTQFGYGLYAYEGALIQLGTGMNFSNCAHAHMAVDAGGTIQSNGNAYTISGPSAAHAFPVLGRISIDTSTVTITGTPAFSAGFAFVNFCGVFTSQSCTFSGSATGLHFAVDNNGVIYTGTGGSAAYLPGSTTGTQNHGGVYN